MDPNGMTWASYERNLRIKKRSPRTIQGYQEAVDQLVDFHDGEDLLELTREQIEAYLLDVMERHSVSTAANRHRSLRAFYNWAVAEELLTASPMTRIPAPAVPVEPVPVVPDDILIKLLRACAGTDYDARRDTAIIRLWCEPGSPRVSEMAGLTLDDLDLRHDQIRILGKGSKVRVIPFGAKTGQALDRFLRVRRNHRDAKRYEHLWLASRGKPLSASGLYQMLERRCVEAGIDRIHPHQLRHTAAHVWADSEGSEADAMVLFGWSSPEMPRRYGASAKVERAQRAARRISPADRI